MANNLHHRLLVKTVLLALRSWREEAEGSRQRREIAAEMFMRVVQDHLADAFLGWLEASRMAKGGQRMMSAVNMVLAQKRLRRFFQVKRLVCAPDRLGGEAL
jgi:hypothetical protein